MEKYTMTLTLKMGIANLGRSYRLPCVLKSSIKFHTAMSIQYIFNIAGVFTVVHMFPTWVYWVVHLFSGPYQSNGIQIVWIIRFNSRNPEWPLSPTHGGPYIPGSNQVMPLYPSSRSIILGTESDMAIPGSKLESHGFPVWVRFGWQPTNQQLWSLWSRRLIMFWSRTISWGQWWDYSNQHKLWCGCV